MKITELVTTLFVGMFIIGCIPILLAVLGVGLINIFKLISWKFILGAIIIFLVIYEVILYSERS